MKSRIVASRKHCTGSIQLKSFSTSFSPVLQVCHSLLVTIQADFPNQVALPANIVSALTLVRTASHWMFALFLTGACTCFVSTFITLLSIYTRWATFPIAIFAFLTALTTTAASIIATVMFIIFRNVVHGAESTVNIVPEVGIKMFAFMWVVREIRDYSLKAYIY